MTAGHLCDHIAEIYGLSEFVTERLELQYEDYKSDGQAKSRKHAAVGYNQKISSLKRHTPDSNGEKVKVEIDDLELGGCGINGAIRLPRTVAATPNGCWRL